MRATVRQCAILLRSGRAFLEIGGRPALFWSMRELQRFGVEEFVLLPCHGAILPEGWRKVLAHAADLLPRRAAWRVAEVPDGLDPVVLAYDGALVFDAVLSPLLAAGRGQAVAGGRAVGFWVCGREALAEAPLGLVAGRGLPGVQVAGWFRDLADEDEARWAARDLAPVLRRPALFLDRDGVLNTDHGYVGTRERWKWVAGAREAVRMATEAGWHVFVATNQSGVARGFYGEEDVRALMAWVADELRAAGGTLDDYRYCPFHPEGTVPAYRRESDWRKPGAGMLKHLIADWDLDPAHAVMVGDKDIDLEAAQGAGVRGVLFEGGDLRDTVARAIASRADPAA